MSASDPRIHFGLGKRSKIESLVITWPSGQVDKLTNVPIDQIIAVKEGVGLCRIPFPKFSANEEGGAAEGGPSLNRSRDIG